MNLRAAEFCTILHMNLIKETDREEVTILHPKEKNVKRDKVPNGLVSFLLFPQRQATATFAGSLEKHHDFGGRAVGTTPSLRFGSLSTMVLRVHHAPVDRGLLVLAETGCLGM